MMRYLKYFPVLSSLLATANAAAVVDPRSETIDVWATPHESFSSSIGVLGCKIDTNRVAYWPEAVDCNNICVSLSYQDRQVYLLRIDQSQGAHDVSYDAFNYLVTGYPATKKPISSGPVAMQAETVDPSNCASLMHTADHKLPLSAANSMNYLASCLGGGTWVADNYVLYNILDPICTLGYDETCNLDWPQNNQATCPHTMGVPAKLDGKGNLVYNIQYPSGRTILASAGPQPESGTPPSTVDPGEGNDDEESAAASTRLGPPGVTMFASATLSLLIAIYYSTPPAR